MKNILQSLKIENIKKELTGVIRRFQVSIILVIVLFFGFLGLIHGDLDSGLSQYLVRFLMSIIIVFPLSISLYLVCEVEKYGSLHKQLIQVFPLIFGVFFYYNLNISFEEFEDIIYFILSLLGVISFLFFAPFLREIQKKSGIQEVYYEYFYSMSAILLFSGILSGVLFLLGVIGIGTVFTLFDIEYSSSNRLYSDWGAISFALFSPLFALSQIPSANNIKNQGNNIHVFFSFLVRFVVLPFILVYFIILYAYSVKVLLHFSHWPRGEVSWMVIGFSLFGYVSYIYSYIFEEKYSIIQTFRRYFPYVILPQLAMLFYAVYLRTAQYDLTIHRYLALALGFWLTSISVYFIFSHKKYLAFIPASLTLVTLIISIGPWSAYQLPLTRQLTRLEQNLTKANMFQSGAIIALKNITDINVELSKEIYNGIDYGCKFNNCIDIKELFLEQYKEIVAEHKINFDKNKSQEIESLKINPSYSQDVKEIKYNDPSHWEIVSGITKRIKVASYNGYDINSNAYISYHKKYDQNIFPLQVKGYDTLLQVRSFGDNLEKNIIYNPKTQSISLEISGKLIETFNLSGDFLRFQQKYSEIYNQDIPSENMMINISGVNYEGKLYIENLIIKNPTYISSSGETQEQSMNGYVLLREKQK